MDAFFEGFNETFVLGKMLPYLADPIFWGLLFGFLATILALYAIGYGLACLLG